MFASLILIVAALALDAGAAEVSNPLQPLSFLLGHCWAGDVPGGVGRDTHCFEPMFGDKFIRDKHVVHGKDGDYSGETIFAFDADQKQIVYWYFSSDGDIDNSTVIPVPGGFDFPERHVTEPKDAVMRTRWRRVGDNAYEATNERKSGNSWHTEWKVQYTRTDAAK